MIKIAIIQKIPGGQYRLYSRKKNPKTNKRKNLGTFPSLSAAKKRERQIQFFRHHSDDGKTDDKETKMLSDLSGIASYLEESGFIDKADQVYGIMNLIDPCLEDNLIDPYPIPDAQMNTGNMGYMGGEGIAGGYSLLSADAGQMNIDGFVEEFDQKALNYLEKRFSNQMIPDEIKKQDEDVIARSNGIGGNSVTDMGGAGMFHGLSDSYFYQGNGSIEYNL